MAAGLLACLPGAAHAAASMRSALCDGYAGAGGCRVEASGTEINGGGQVMATVWGNAGVAVAVMLYLVDFNASGAITGLVPVSDPQASRTIPKSGNPSEGWSPQPMMLTARPPASSPSGGWLLVGLADDTSDLATQIQTGTLLPYGGATLRSLGDTYAEQKPVGTELKLDVIGQVPGERYWVEYETEAGTWLPAGPGFGDAPKLDGPPDQRRQLTYVVPDTLTRDKEYRFRVNSSLNYDRDLKTPVAEPAAIWWRVRPSDTAAQNLPTKEQGKEFDKTLAPGQADLEPFAEALNDPDVGWDPPSQPSPTPTTQPQPTGQPEPSGSPKPKPSEKAPDPSPPADAGGAAATAPTATAPTGTAPAPAGGGEQAPPSVTAAAPPLAADTGQTGQTGQTGPAGSVWGREATTSSTAGPVLQASPGLGRVLGLLGVLLLLAPGAWWRLSRRWAARDAEEPLA